MNDHAHSHAKANALIASAFESSVLRVLAYTGLSAYAIATAVFVTLQGTTTKIELVAKYHAPGFAVWFSLLTLALYYGHLTARRFRIGLGAFLLLALVWCNGTAFTWALAGWEAGLTVALGLAAGLSYARCWSGSVAQLLGIERPERQAALYLLGVARAASFAGLLLGLLALILGLNFGVGSIAQVGSVLLGLSALALTGSEILSFRARRAARRLLAAPPAPGA